MASDEDLKLSDLLRYYLRDTDAAKALLYRRAKCLSEFDNANKALEKARTKNKDIAGVSFDSVLSVVVSRSEFAATNYSQDELAHVM